MLKRGGADAGAARSSKYKGVTWDVNHPGGDKWYTRINGEHYPSEEDASKAYQAAEDEIEGRERAISSKYKGVTYDKSAAEWRSKVWIAQITRNGVHQTLGRFDTEEAAYAAYKDADRQAAQAQATQTAQAQATQTAQAQAAPTAKWQVEFTHNGVLFNLGAFDSEGDAEEAYRSAVEEIMDLTMKRPFASEAAAKMARGEAWGAPNIVDGGMYDSGDDYSDSGGMSEYGLPNTDDEMDVGLDVRDLAGAPGMGD
jgi:hypothetical protein